MLQFVVDVLQCIAIIGIGKTVATLSVAIEKMSKERRSGGDAIPIRVDHQQIARTAVEAIGDMFGDRPH